jgi:hypothetical protein
VRARAARGQDALILTEAITNYQVVAEHLRPTGRGPAGVGRRFARLVGRRHAVGAKLAAPERTVVAWSATALTCSACRRRRTGCPPLRHADAHRHLRQPRLASPQVQSTLAGPPLRRGRRPTTSTSRSIPRPTCPGMAHRGRRRLRRDGVRPRASSPGPQGRPRRRPRRPLRRRSACSCRDVLSRAEFSQEITEILLHTAPALTGQQILEVRQGVLEFARKRGWVDV